MNHENNSYHRTVNLDKLEYVYGLIAYNNQAFLFCFDAHQHRIPVEFKGFKKPYITLSERFGFKDKLFYDTISQNKQTKARIWKRDYKKNYKIVESDINVSKGFSTGSTNKEFFNWDLPLGSFDAADTSETITNDYGHKCLKFLDKVRIGNIEVDELFAYVGKRIDAPILHYTAKLRNDKGDHDSYFNAKAAIHKLKNTDDLYSLYERDDQNSITWEKDGISISITYTYDSTYAYESCYTSLNIRNKRDYPELYKNNNDLTRNSIESFYVFKKKLWSKADYRSDSSIKKKPKLIIELSKGFPVIWINIKSNAIGFGGQKFCQEFKVAEIESIHLQNIHPAKGSGGSYLELKLKGVERRQYVLGGKYQDFDSHLVELEKILNKKIIIEKEYADV